jgi:hypothetical protein
MLPLLDDSDSSELSDLTGCLGCVIFFAIMLWTLACVAVFIIYVYLKSKGVI